ncbi:ATP-binding cassette, regulator of translational elongation [Spiromyces aspiralis]|uniref:ATP-binding cassette, regulator of translational elongation n=1 Tax=Spiromyces aspiralis TaxID=68401 RepID=A0ACC1HFZ1_9FUNG|nr:ATP-binding cassette, regulator of translational elongation [Spiromyces aspiralis]
MTEELITSAELDKLIASCVPEIDTTISDYLEGYVKDRLASLASGLSGAGPPTAAINDEDGEDPIKGAIRPILESSGGDTKRVGSVCDQLAKLFERATAIGREKHGQNDANGPAKLAVPVNMRAQQAHIDKAARLAQTRPTDLAHTKGRVVASQVDTEKLRKAEARIAAKLQKRELRSDYEASKIVSEGQGSTIDDEELLLKVNPVIDYTSTRGKSKDTHLEDFDISYAGHRILTGASLHLTYGRRYGLIGRNGIGKSTLLRHLSRRELPVPTYISILHVEQEMHGDDTTALRSVVKANIFREQLLKEEKELSAELTKLEEEDPFGPNGEKLTKMEIEAKKNELGTQLNTVMEKLADIGSDEAEAKAAEILYGLGFSASDIQRPTKSFSGGWRMRLSLARALFCKPDLLLLDEPTNMLDIPAVVWLERYLAKWPNTLLVVSHDREFLDEVATDIIHQHSERLDQYRGNFASFWATREERRKNQQREYDSQMQYRQHLQEFIDKWRYNAKRAPQAQMKIKILEKLPILTPPEDDKAVTFRFPNPDKISPPVLYMDNVTFGYSPDRIILRNVNIDMQMDARVAIVGPNGAGKTTLLKLLIGNLEPMSGIVHRHGRLRIAYFSQHHVDQLDVNLTAVGHLAKMFPGKSQEEYRRMLGHFGISGMTGLQTIKTLSGGQKSRVAFATLAAMHPHFLVLDEPTNHLDMESIDALTMALNEFRGGVVIVSHDERFIDSVCTEMWVCANGVVTKFKGEGIKEYKNMICPPET